MQTYVVRKKQWGEMLNYFISLMSCGVGQVVEYVNITPGNLCSVVVTDPSALLFQNPIFLLLQECKIYHF